MPDMFLSYSFHEISHLLETQFVQTEMGLYSAVVPRRPWTEFLTYYHGYFFPLMIGEIDKSNPFLFLSDSRIRTNLFLESCKQAQQDLSCNERMEPYSIHTRATIDTDMP